MDGRPSVDELRRVSYIEGSENEVASRETSREAGAARTDDAGRSGIRRLSRSLKTLVRRTLFKSSGVVPK